MWLLLAIPTGVEISPFPNANKYLGTIGRNAIVSPLFQEMIKIDRDAAWSIFQTHIDFYHPITRDSVNGLFESGVDMNIYPTLANW